MGAGRRGPDSRGGRGVGGRAWGAGGADARRNVKNALSHKHLGLINKWLRNLKDVCRIHRHELDGIADSERRLRRLVELNVQEQVAPDERCAIGGRPPQRTRAC